MPDEEKATAPQPGPQPAAAQQTLRLDDTKMRSTYANFANVSSTREEFVLMFGTNTGWQGGSQDLAVQLSDRIILSPFVAKRLALVLAGVVQEYERRFGVLTIDASRPTA
jgi:hypothetical protein